MVATCHIEEPSQDAELSRRLRSCFWGGLAVDHISECFFVWVLTPTHSFPPSSQDETPATPGRQAALPGSHPLTVSSFSPWFAFL